MKLAYKAPVLEALDLSATQDIEADLDLDVDIDLGLGS